MEKEKLIRLVQGAQSGDPTAIEALFTESYDDVYYFALKTVKNADLACDITQETFLQVIQSIHSLKEPLAFVTWIRQIAYFQCTRHFSKNREVLVEEDEDGNSIFDTVADDSEDSIPSEVLEQAEFRQTILGMVDRLTEEQRSAVLLYYFEELSVGQIAQIQGVSEGTVKSRLNYARKALKKAVENYEEKHNIKLHSFSFLPLFLLYFGKELMPAAKAAAVQKTVVAAAAKAASAAAGTASASAASGGFLATLGKLPLITKIVAGILAVALVATPILILTRDTDEHKSSRKNRTEPTSAETTFEQQEEPEGTADEEAPTMLQVKRPLHTVAASYRYVIAIKDDGTAYISIPADEEDPVDAAMRAEILSWTDLVSVAASYYHVVGLKSDGTVVATGHNTDGQCDVETWTDVVTISVSDSCTIGVRQDGTILYTGINFAVEAFLQTNDLREVAYVATHPSDGWVAPGTAIVFQDGTAWTNDGYYFENSYHEAFPELNDLTGIAQADIHHLCAAVLMCDGTVKKFPVTDGYCVCKNWTDIVQIAIGSHVIGLKKDGTVVVCGSNMLGECNTEDWTDIAAVYDGPSYTMGLKKDGTLITTTDRPYEDFRRFDWTNIRVPE